MIPLGLVLIGLGVVAIVSCWDDILEWLSDFLPRVANFIRTIGKTLGPMAEYVTEMIGELLDKASTAIKHYLYYKQNGQWIEETTKRILPESELPPRIKRKLRRKGQEEDITDEIELETGLTV